jgi:hypothetical protein
MSTPKKKTTKRSAPEPITVIRAERNCGAALRPLRRVMRRHQRQAAASPEAQRASAQAIVGARAGGGSLPRGVTPNEPGRRTNFTWQNVLDTITALQAVRETPVLVWANPSVVFDVSDNTMARDVRKHRVASSSATRAW